LLVTSIESGGGAILVVPPIFCGQDAIELIEKQPYGSHSRRMNYQLTELGTSLRPVLRAMAVWGLRNIPDTKTPERKQPEAGED
jgi:DNA-binding HxlR family transcriptional regulator